MTNTDRSEEGLLVVAKLGNNKDIVFFKVGNAVAPPMGKFLGLEIRIAMDKAANKKANE